MADKKRLSAEQQKNLITEAERNRIANMIAGRGMSGKHVT